MKKIIFLLSSILFMLNTQAQWSSFPGSATEISCGSLTELASILNDANNSTLSKYNFTNSTWETMAGFATQSPVTSVGLSSDGTLWTRRDGTFYPISNGNLAKFNVPATFNSYTPVNGLLDNISVLSNSSAIGAVGTGNDNIYITTSTANTFGLLPGSTNFSAKKVIFAGNGDLLAINQGVIGNNIFRYTSGAWVAVPSTTVINATDIAVGQNTNQMLAVSGGHCIFIIMVIGYKMGLLQPILQELLWHWITVTRFMH